MTAPNFGGQPNQGQQQQGWSPGQQQQNGQPQQQMQAPQQGFNPQTTVVQTEPHVQFPAPYFPPQQQQQQNNQQNQLYPNAPQYAPAWQGGQQQPQQQQPWQQQQPQQQQPTQRPMQQQAPAPAQNVQFDQSGRMFGAGLPQELQGKTMQEAIQIYGMMRQGYTAASQQQRPQQQQQQQQQTPTQQGQVAAQSRPSSPWTDPEGFFGRLLDEKLGAMLGPVVQRTNEQEIAGVRDDISSRYPQYQQYEAAVLQRLEGLPVETLKNPQAWELALSAVVGEQMLRGGGQQQRPQQNNGGQAVLPWQSANQGWQQQNQPQQHQSFFTESPSAVMQGGFVPGDQQFQQGAQNLSAAQLEVARRFGISPAQYAQGMGVR